MCGIIGIFNDKRAQEKVAGALEQLRARGRDGSGNLLVESGVLGHTLHAIVGNVPQPLDCLTVNCEIYNWKELAKKHKVNAENDAELLLKLLDKDGIRILEELDGVFAFGHLKDGKLTVARDLIGVKPVWYSHGDSFAFCSERKVLEKLGFSPIHELNPRHYLVYDVKTKGLESVERPYFKTKPEHKGSEAEIVKELIPLLESSVKKRIPEQKVGVLFSGGVDSTLIAVLLKKMGLDPVCYTTAVEIEGMKSSSDMEAAELAAKQHGLRLKRIILTLDDVKDALERIVPLIEDTSVVKVGVAATLDAACKAAAIDGCKVVFSGLGSEELFAGYQRHRESTKLNEECLAGLRKVYEGDTYRDDVVSMSHSVEIRLPFLDKELTEYALKIPADMKLKDGVEKRILRLAAEKLGVSKEIAWRKKKAAQYGSNVHKAMVKLSKSEGHKTLSSYLRTFYTSRQLRLAALLSSGKDSHYAMYTMVRQNYDIKCGITLKSKNPDSYMFHTPNIGLVELQSEAMGLPLIVKETEGEKEKELADLEEALKKAVEMFHIEGVITGALYSTYQRDRIEAICEKLGLKVFNPLWHIDQETEVRQLLEDGFEVWLASVACDGLDKSWLGRPLTQKDVDRLVELNRKIGINIAGEGGEYESMVLNSPMFERKIEIKKSTIKEESEHVARLEIKEALLTTLR